MLAFSLEVWSIALFGCAHSCVNIATWLINLLLLLLFTIKFLIFIVLMKFSCIVTAFLYHLVFRLGVILNSNVNTMHKVIH